MSNEPSNNWGDNTILPSSVLWPAVNTISRSSVNLSAFSQISINPNLFCLLNITPLGLRYILFLFSLRYC